MAGGQRVMFALPAVSDNRGGRRRTEGPAGRQIIRWMGRRRSILSAPSNGGGEADNGGSPRPQSLCEACAH